jgi:alginate O-acetyltransferase complex protein AlgI
MLFNSYLFLLLFLPLSLAGYFFCNAREKYEWGKIWLTGMSLWFYAYFNIHYLPIILGSILFNYFLYRLLTGRWENDIRRRKYLTAVGVFANLGVLFYYKYYDFFLENMNAAFHLDLPLKQVLLPLGISFFTFQQVGFLVDSYRGETKGYSFLDYALFVTFFPQLVAGPIVTHDEMIGQFADLQKKTFCPANAAKGLYAFAQGLAKKILIADIFGKAVSFGFGSLETLNGLAALWMMVCYMVQLYFDFSGYCDMARGIGFMFNIEIPVNFLSPYKAVNLVDFWKRWHITLNRFFTRYVYIPLGGNRKGSLRTYFNIFMIYLVSGIWHGAGWTYLCWGILHGIVYVLTRRFLEKIEKIPSPITWFCNLVFFLFSLIFFRAENMGQAAVVIKRIVCGDYVLSNVPAAFWQQFRTPEFFYVLKLLRLDRLLTGGLAGCDLLLSALYMGIAWMMLLCCKNVSEKTESFCPTKKNGLWTAFLLLWSLVSLSEVSSFLYFNF